MAIPDFQACMLPLLRFATDSGPCHLDVATKALEDHFNLSQEEKAQLYQSGQTVIWNRVAWARTYLKQAGLLEYPGRGMLQITEEGKNVLSSGVEKIDTKYLERYPSFMDFRKRSKSSVESPAGLNPDQLVELLLEFAEVADNWFAAPERHFVVDYWKFMRDFFDAENLEKVDWPDIQRLGEHIHSLHSNALAKTRAFGNPNYSIEQYRKTLYTLAHGQGDVEERMRWFLIDDNAASKYLGSSSVSEIMGQLNADTHVFFNKRDEEAARYLGIEPGFTRADDDARRFAKFNQALRPIFEAYREIVGKRTEVPIGIEIDQFFSWLYETKNLGKRQPLPRNGSSKVWEYAPGPNAVYWEQFYKESIAAIGWNGIGDLRQFRSREGIADAIKKVRNTEAEPRNDSLALWQFCNDMQPGDIILVKKGRRTLVGMGVVEGVYQYQEGRPDYDHVRKVRWEQKGSWPLPEGLNLTTKTLTDLTPYPDHVAKLKGLFAKIIPLPARNYWWINCNPTTWDIANVSIGQREIFTSYNADGNKRQKYKYFEEVNLGDEVLAYVTSPVRRLTSRLVVTKELEDTPEGEGIELEVVEHFAVQPEWETLQKDDRLAECEPLKNNQGTLFSLTENEVAAIREIIDGVTPDTAEPYTVEDALDDLYMPEETFRDIIERLKTKRNVILQGPPGVGKTFVAQRVAYALMGYKDQDRVRMVQFHQSYSYEDFVRGYRPSENGGFILKDGIFYEFCLRARADERPYVFIIDEINRGNLSKILGELMMLIEHDKRTPLYAVPLVYHKDGESNFFVPGNVYIIGLMNTADRSLAMVDYALRRRFSFTNVMPAFEEEKFRQRLIEMSGDGLGDRIAKIFIELNRKIAEDDKNLGAGFCMGHSYFCIEKTDFIDRQSYLRIIETEIAPLLQEYWFDQPKTAKEWIAELKAVAG
ncbi:MAG: AAA family ATPase [Nitrospirae bacterium]|nr:AAA family ATPase [Nitrospirota bacterium]